MCIIQMCAPNLISGEPKTSNIFNLSNFKGTG